MKKNLTAKIKGGFTPRGKVRVSGAKNAATRLLAAAMVSDEEVSLINFPAELVDAQYTADFIRKCGGQVNVDAVNEIVNISCAELNDATLVDYNYPIRTTYLLAAGLIKRHGRARIPYPGGCKIGNRGYDLHVMVWKSLGAQVIECDEYIEIIAKGGFRAGQINFPITTIGGTENALICAATISGDTVIRNAYVSPEVYSLIDFLRHLGVRIEVVGNSFIKITGRPFLKGAIFEVIPDRIEALTWMIYGVLSGGDITIEDVPFNVMEIPLIHLQEAGIDFYRNSKSVHITPDCLINGVIQPFELATGTHPGVISDMQPFYVLLGLHGDGISRVFDYRYPERLKYCEELLKFYPDMLQCETGRVTAFGRHGFRPVASEVGSTDLRGSMTVLMAALLSPGVSTINNVEMALRGYNKLQEKLIALGVEIEIS